LSTGALIYHQGLGYFSHYNSSTGSQTRGLHKSSILHKKTQDLSISRKTTYTNR